MDKEVVVVVVGNLEMMVHTHTTNKKMMMMVGTVLEVQHCATDVLMCVCVPHTKVLTLNDAEKGKTTTTTEAHKVRAR